MAGYAWVTLATNDSYSLGALVLAHSLRHVSTAHQLAVLVTPGVTEAMRTQLSAVFNVVMSVDVLDSGDTDNLALLARPDLGVTFTKLHCWRLTQFQKCVFLDADTLVLQNCDELFERDELSAAPDAGWPDCFNSGVFVFKPSNDTYKALIEFALIHGSFDGGDQGLLNLFFSDWATKDIIKHLPFIYNMCSTATYSYLPAFKQFGQGLKIVHFIGAGKPWLQPFNTETGLARVSTSSTSEHVQQFVQLWWDLFCTHVHPSLSTQMAGLAAALATVTLGAPLSAEQLALEEHLRRQGWEQGSVDYMGKDSFSNIWLKICDTLSSGPQPGTVPPESPSPFAPVAAPVFVSSVEISPTGPVDTSPPANYAPVSALKPAVVASDTEAAKIAVTAETATVVSEAKSSVTEVVPTEAGAMCSAASDTPAQPSTPAVTAPADIDTTDPALPGAPVSVTANPLYTALIAPTLSPPATISTGSTPSGPAETPAATPLETQAAAAAPPVETQAALPPVETQAVAAPAVETQVASPPVETQAIAPPVETQTAAAAPLQTQAAASPVQTQATPPPPSESEAVAAPLKTVDATPAETPARTPNAVATKSLVVTSSEVAAAVPTVVPAAAPTETSAAASTEIQVVQVENPASPLSDPAESSVPISTKPPAPALTEASISIVKEPPAVTSVQTPTTSVKPASTESPVSSPVAVDASAPTPSSPMPTPTPTQPGTPTVTESTPPTSPPVASLESPLAAKLQVAGEIPETPPPAGVTLTQSAPSEEPPVPPKRKGGSKAIQEAKNQKGGKPAKGKK